MKKDVQTGADLDEDLFDFPQVSADAEATPEAEENLEELLASFRDNRPAEDLLAVPAAAGAPALEPPPSEERASDGHGGRTSRADADEGDVEPRLADIRFEVEEPASPAPRSSQGPPRPRKAARSAPSTVQVEPELPPAPMPSAPLPPLPSGRVTGPRLSRSVLAIVLSVTLLNSALAFVVLRGSTGHGDEVRAIDHASSEEPAPENAVPSTEPGLPDPEQTPKLHDHPALATAREEIARGEYGAARQRVYALLSIIDRLEDPRRGEIEAECQFLVAQSLHLEALARMGRSE